MASIIQISDTHFGTEQPPVVDALVNMVRAQNPDLVVLSGDITQRARSRQFQAACQFTDRLQARNLLTIPGRMCENGKPVPVDAEDFRMWAANLAVAGEAAYKAAQAKDLDMMVDVAGTVSDACSMCHEKYRDTPDQPRDRC